MTVFIARGLLGRFVTVLVAKKRMAVTDDQEKLSRKYVEREPAWEGPTKQVEMGSRSGKLLKAGRRGQMLGADRSGELNSWG